MYKIIMKPFCSTIQVIKIQNIQNSASHKPSNRIYLCLEFFLPLFGIRCKHLHCYNLPSRHCCFINCPKRSLSQGCCEVLCGLLNFSAPCKVSGSYSYNVNIPFIAFLSELLYISISLLSPFPLSSEPR